MTSRRRGPFVALALTAAIAAVVAAAPAMGRDPSAGAARPPDSAAAARGEARRILAEGRFRERSFPRPLRGVLSALGEAIRPVSDFVGRAIGGLAGLLPGGRPVGFVVLAAGLLAGFAALTARQLRTRTSGRVASAAAIAAPPGAGPSPRELERAAAEAERAGELDLAVRLRFRAGLLRLGERGAIDARPSLTTAAIVRRVDSAELTRLARDFEQIAYGGRRAEPDDVESQRSGWPRVLEEARS